tara:strand:- start:94 stop:1638 length:1545 start_codon:yes stop_codon:yes gene_type:complete
MVTRRAPELEIDPSVQGTRTPAFESAMGEQAAVDRNIPTTNVNQQQVLSANRPTQFLQGDMPGQTAQTDRNLYSKLQTESAKVIPQLQAQTQQLETPELQQKQGLFVDPAGQQAGVQQVSPVGIETALPQQPGDAVGQIQGIERIAPQIQDIQVSQITDRPLVDIPGIQGEVSQGAIATAATQELDQRATTKFQMEQLIGSIEEGKPLPAWASPAVRKITGIMQQRGLSGSSMAAAAMTQAVMEAGVVIATQDANKYAGIQLQNLKNEQQAALQNAAAFASMDKANLSVRMQGAVTNAQTLLAIETKNLDARQTGNTISYNALTQSLFKDSAQENARQQFNAKNELQVDEFFAQLSSQVETANKNRVSAMAQYNAGEVNAQQQFNAAMRDQRDKFNSNMQYAVDQSNVNWRRQINTANTSLLNDTNRINVQNAYNVSQNAMNNLWQSYRDNAAWNFQKGESFLQKQHEIGIMAMEFANTKELYNKQQKDNLAMGIGNWIATWMAGSKDTKKGTD